ncbi:MAG: hypothetical protein QG656_681, partial [Candidatus Hydrogenedentes bacterium]|nr:hypothetical protein [Candidatus Hydrogenedentota bacterium]
IEGTPPDRRGYNFDGCAPEALITRASAKDGRIVFPDGMSYRLLVLPRFDTMTPRLLRKVAALVEDGATVMGAPPRKSPSLTDYPDCDRQVRELAEALWGGDDAANRRNVGKGLVIGDEEAAQAGTELYPGYDTTARVLAELGVPPDFACDGNLRYIHRREGGTDLYFIANRDGQPQTAVCRFRAAGRQPEWWDPLTGARRDLPEFSEQDGVTTLPVRLDAFGSGFVVFRKPVAGKARSGVNFPELEPILTLTAPWEVSFDPKWGGPEKAVFATLDDWRKRLEPGIQYYSGKAVYRTAFDCAADAAQTRCFLSLGKVKNMASVKLNGTELGTVWCEPWQIEIPSGILREKDNRIEVTVANLWINRLIGDSALLKDQRLTWTTLDAFHPDSPLQESGLLGPVTIKR